MYQAGHGALRTGMNALEFPGGVTVRTFSPPPDGFDPVKADEKELLAYGYPSRPQDPALAERWERVLSRSVRQIQPTFRNMPHERRRRPEVTASAAHAEFNGGWSGAFVYAPDADPFRWVEGEWTVPNTFWPSDAADSYWYSASTWMSIDGIRDGLLTGCDSDVMTSGGVIHRQLSPWWQLQPMEPVLISNLPVAQGDTVHCLIIVDSESATAATIVLVNMTSGVSASFQATAPPGTSLAGKSAEWGVSGPNLGSGKEIGLARFGDVYFAEASALTTADTVINAGSGDSINLVDESDNVFATGRIESPTLIQVRYAGP